MTFWSWMANARTSSFTVRIPVWNRSGLTLRSVGLSCILFPVLCEQDRSAFYQRVRRVHLLLGFACVSPHVYRTRDRWTRPLGVGWRWHSLRDPRGVVWFAPKSARFFQGDLSWPLRDSPVSLAMMHEWYFGLRGHSGEIAGKIYVRPLLLVFGFFCVVETLLFGGEVCLFGICGLVGPDILVQVLPVLLWRSLTLVGG